MVIRDILDGRRSTVVIGRNDGMCDFALEFCSFMYAHIRVMNIHICMPTPLVDIHHRKVICICQLRGGVLKACRYIEYMIILTSIPNC